MTNHNHPLSLTVALRGLINATSDMLTGIQVHNQSSTESRKADISGPVVSQLVRALSEARAALADAEEYNLTHKMAESHQLVATSFECSSIDEAHEAMKAALQTACDGAAQRFAHEIGAKSASARVSSLSHAVQPHPSGSLQVSLLTMIYVWHVGGQQ